MQVRAASGLCWWVGFSQTECMQDCIKSSELKYNTSKRTSPEKQPLNWNKQGAVGTLTGALRVCCVLPVLTATVCYRGVNSGPQGGHNYNSTSRAAHRARKASTTHMLSPLPSA